MNASTLRNFGLVFAAFLSGAGLLLFAAHRVELWAAAGAVAVLALVAPKTLVPLYWVSARVGAVLGWVNTRVLLGLVFFLLVLPVGLLRRRGRSPLTQGPDRSAASYRVAREPDADPARFERPY